MRYYASYFHSDPVTVKMLLFAISLNEKLRQEYKEFLSIGADEIVICRLLKACNMCSLYDVDEYCGNSDRLSKKSFNDDTTCRSCPEKGWVVLRKKDVYCKKCFLSVATHKFRAALGKSKMMKLQDRVLVAYSGSQSSTALLHLLHTGTTEDQHKRLMFSVNVLFIDEGPLFEMGVEERVKLVNRVKDELSCYDFPVITCSLSDSLKESFALESELGFNEKYDRQLINLFQNIKSMSSKEDLLYLLRQKLILRVAEKLNCDKVFTAEVGTDLAVKLLSRFCLGRGDQASYETGFCDSHHPNIKILRPLRDFTKKEIVFYNKFQNLELITCPSLTTKSPANISIQKLTEKFVADLQEGFPSTVYTIFRTGEKLAAGVVVQNSNDSICLLCKGSLETNKNGSKYTAVEAANFSSSVSKKPINNQIKRAEGCCGSCSGRKAAEIDASELKKYFCYGCTSILRDLTNVDLLPNDMVQSIIQRGCLETMKEQISDFLIEND